MVREALETGRTRFKHRVHAPIAPLRPFLPRVADPDRSCRAAVARSIAWRAFRGLAPRGEQTGAYRDARGRLPTCFSGASARVGRGSGNGHGRRGRLGASPDSRPDGVFSGRDPAWRSM